MNYVVAQGAPNSLVRLFQERPELGVHLLEVCYVVDRAIDDVPYTVDQWVRVRASVRSVINACSYSSPRRPVDGLAANSPYSQVDRANRTADDAFGRVTDARMGSGVDTTPDFRAALRGCLADWLASIDREVG